MAQPSWFDSNRNRAYPLVSVTDAGDLPDDALVDAGFVVGPHAGFEADTHSVSLVAVRREASTLFFDFASDSPGLDGVVLTFERGTGVGRYVTSFSDSNLTASQSTETEAECEEPQLSGFLVTGDLQLLLSILTGDGELALPGGGLVVEPALVQNLSRGYVTSLNVGNGDRTRVVAPAECDETVWPFETGVVFVYDVCLTGLVLVRAGYNAGVSQDDVENRIRLQAVVGGGVGQPCDEVPLFGGETPPAGSDLLTGGPTCFEVLRSINGLAGPRNNLQGGLGVTVTADPDNNTVVIDADFTGMAGCYATDTTESEVV